MHEYTVSAMKQVQFFYLSWNNSVYTAVYNEFGVTSEADGYRLKISGYWTNSTLPNSMNYHNKRRFKSRGRCYQNEVCICTTNGRNGWWHDNCWEANPNGKYRTVQQDGSGVIGWKGVPGYSDYYAFKQAHVLIGSMD